jgi:glutamate dehydrogenase (NAD(P)+)
MAADVTVDECARLARAMTLKNVAAGLAHGGAKCVIQGEPRMPATHKEALLRALARALSHETDYIFGPDMGTDERCMGWIHDEIGRAVGRPQVLGGLALDAIGATGWGVMHVAKVAAAHIGLKLRGARVAIQGFGSVGQHAARFLVDEGAVVVAASDSQGSVIDAAGLDLAQLLRLKAQGLSLIQYPAGSHHGREAIIDVQCDLWIPAARPDVLDATTAARLKARLVVEGANLACTPQALEMLAARGVLVVPDFIANAGGVICAAMELQGATQTMAMEAVAQRIAANTAEILGRARHEARPPREVALEIAQARVHEAMQVRRFGLF